MKIGILSERPETHSTRRLVQAAGERGHDVRVIDYLHCDMNIASHRPTLSLRDERLEGLDAVIPRIGAAKSAYGLAVVRQLEMMKVYSVNSSQSIARARDKLRCLQILARKGVGLPVTAMSHSTENTDALIEMVGGTPLVIKLLEGTHGVGVVLAETQQAARSVIEAFRGLNVNILIQEFIAEAKGADIRAFVVGDRVVAAMKRQGAPGEFRSNLHRGGAASKIKLTPEERSTAVRSAKALGLRVAGVDLLRANHGPAVMEVNSSPGLEGIEGVTGIDVAGAIIEYIERDAASRRTDNVQA